jgi:hypothetical protein
VADAAQEVVLGGVELAQLAVLRLDPGIQLGVPDRGRHLAREQLEQVLVGAFPATRGRQPPDEDAHVLAPGAHHRPQRTRDARHDLLFLHERGVAHDDRRIDQLERRRRVLTGPLDQCLDVVLQRHLVDGGEDAAELAVASLEVRGEAVVAIGEASQLIVADDLHRAREVAFRHAIDGGHDRPQRRQQLGRERECRHDREREEDRQREQQDLGEGDVRGVGTDEGLERQDDDPEHGERDDRREQQRQGQS